MIFYYGINSFKSNVGTPTLIAEHAEKRDGGANFLLAQLPALVLSLLFLKVLEYSLLR